MIAPGKNVSGEVDVPAQLEDLSITAFRANARTPDDHTEKAGSTAVELELLACAGKVNDAAVLVVLAAQTSGADTASENTRQLESHGSTESQKASPSAAPIISAAGKNSEEKEFEYKKIASEKLRARRIYFCLGANDGYEDSSEDEDFVARSPQVQPTSMICKPAIVPNKLTAQTIKVPKAAELSSSPATSPSTRGAEDHRTHGAVSDQSELSEGNPPDNKIKDEPAKSMRIPYRTALVASSGPSIKSLEVQNGTGSVVTPHPRPSMVRAQKIQFSALRKQGETEGGIAATPTGWSGQAGEKKSVQVNKED